MKCEGIIPRAIPLFVTEVERFEETCLVDGVFAIPLDRLDLKIA